nr:hypothetical protein [Paraburkholderia phenazinium]
MRHASSAQDFAQGDCHVVFQLDSRYRRGAGFWDHQRDVARGQRQVHP